MDCSPPGSSAHGIFQARVLEWGVPLPSPIMSTTHKNNNNYFLILLGEFQWQPKALSVMPDIQQCSLKENSLTLTFYCRSECCHLSPSLSFFPSTPTTNFPTCTGLALYFLASKESSVWTYRSHGIC